MAGWTRYDGPAVALPIENIDTDQLIPARFMLTSRAESYGGFLLHDLRRDAVGALDPAFPLNRHEGVGILVAGANFGVGSSREAAVYALVDAGVRAVCAPSFGDIFVANAVNNGLLPAVVAPQDHGRLLATLGDGAAEGSVDLAARTIQIADRRAFFTLDETWRTKLINGWDDIDLTLVHKDAIDLYKQERIRTAAWAWPSAGG